MREDMSGDEHIEVQMEFLPTDCGGKKKPARSGYRVQFYYAGGDWDALYEFPDVDQANPGDTVRALLTFLSPHNHHGRITVGMPFLTREGQKVFAYGTVTKVFPKLEADAEYMIDKYGSG
jgi:translation elongation factor EF-Tu-like GTPase